MALINNTITRVPPGINGEVVGAIFNNIRKPDPTKYHEYFEDFDYYVAANFTITETDAGATQALTAGDGGLLLLTNTAADNDLNQVQKAVANFTFEAGKELYFRARFQGSDATNSDLVIGLQLVNADGTDLTVATDGLFFLKPDDSTTLTVYYRKNATTGSTSGAVTTMANATALVVEAYFDGVDRVYYGYNGTIVGYLDGSSTYMPDTTLAPIMAVKNGAAAAKTMTVDYIYVAKARYSL